MSNTGAIGEAAFIVEALKRGIETCIPYEQISPYDVLVKTKSGWKRVQVKTCDSMHKCGGYKVTCSKRGDKVRYTRKDTDLVAAYIIPEDTFYIVPIKEVRSTTLVVYPHKEDTGIYETYKDDWQLLK